MPNTRASQDARDELISRLGWGVSAVSVLFGAAIIACHIESGADRWSAAAWQFALQVPGSPATWGVVILLAGLAMVCGKATRRYHLYHWGCVAGVVWFILLTGASVLAFLDDPRVNPLGPIAWGFMAFIYGLLIKYTGKRAHE